MLRAQRLCCRFPQSTLCFQRLRAGILLLPSYNAAASFLKENAAGLFSGLFSGAAPLEYPQFLTHEMSRMPDFIGRDEFSEVK